MSFLLIRDSYKLLQPILDTGVWQLVGNCFWAQRNHHSINCISHVILILMTKFCEKCPISRINIARIPQMARDVFGFYKHFILCPFKNPKDISCKASQLSIFRLWTLSLKGPFKSATTMQKWAQNRCFHSLSDFVTMTFRFITRENIPGCIYSQKGCSASQIQIF